MKNKMLITLFITFASLESFASEIGDLPEVKEITKGQPKDVVSLIERIVECSHWGGEQPFDKVRADEIRKAVEEAGCSRINSDEQTLNQKYKPNKKVPEAIRRAKLLTL